MSFGAGHIQDMLNKIKQNNALRNSKRKKFKGGINYFNSSKTKTSYNFPKLSKAELEKFKLKVQLEVKQEKKKQVLFLILVSIAAFLLFLIFNFY
ncbi:hypothetical protein ACFQZW_04915 [Lutibacter aestuarii]|uniref:Riboflavin synthase subunit beta n=1 Tax=Lutibacter aestuarii TaxID=861111 RepID=A0ABW2Z477_9FLAO